jgi:hypothetical protein
MKHGSFEVIVVKGLRYVRCIKEFKSLVHPSEDCGQLDSVYRVVQEIPVLGYLVLAELSVGYVNTERFKEVTVS